MANKSAAAADGTPSPLVRLWGIEASRIHTVNGLVAEALVEQAIPFIDSVVSPASSSSASSSASPSASKPAWKPKGVKKYKASNAPVGLSERVVPAAALAPIADGSPVRTETWACRRSVHADAARRGTASWDEFVRCFLDQHVASEHAFTPNIVAAHTIQTFDCGLDLCSRQAEDGTLEAGGRRWGRLTMELFEVRHRIGAPLRDRVFLELQATATAAAGDEFVVVTVPMVEDRILEAATLTREAGVVVGRYASVERIGRTGGGEVEWIMATVADGGGVLPMCVQKRAVPSQIAKDVSLFLKWIAEEREGQGAGGGGAGAGGAVGERRVEN